MSVSFRDKWSQAVTRCAGGVVVALGVMVLIGWYTHSTFLIQVLPQFVPMQYNTALGFLLSGVGLLSLSFEKKTVTFAVGVVVFLIGMLTLIQYVSGLSLGIDQLLMEHYVTTKTSFPGRMAPNTALCFSLTGITLVLYADPERYSSRRHFIRGFGCLVLALGIVALVGYLGRVEAAYGWANHTRMAVHTSIGFVIVGGGIMCFTLSNWSFTWQQVSPGWLSGISAFIVFMLGLSLSQNASEQKIQQIKNTQRHEFLLVQKHITSTFRTHMLAMERMADRWAARDGTPIDEWRKDVQNYIANQPGLKAIEWVDRKFRVRWIEPMKGNEAALNLDLTFEPKRAKALRKSRDTRVAALSSPIELVQGGKGFLAFFPIFMGDKFDGFILGVFDVKAVLDSVLPITFKNDYNVLFRIGNEQVELSDETDHLHMERWAYQGSVDVYGITWRLTTWPKRSFLTERYTYLPETILFSGLFIALLIALSIYSAVSAYKHSLQLVDSEEEHRAVVENAVDGLITIDDNGIIEKMNSACEKIFGYSQQEMVGSNIKLLMPEPYHSEHDEYLGWHLQTGDKKIIGVGREVQGRRRDGSVFPIDLSVSEVNISGKKLFSGIIRDITERRNAEVEREQLIEKLTDSNEQLERFAYVCSHDMQEPMRMVRSFSRKLEDHLGERLQGDEKAKRYLRFVTDGAERSQNLVEDILTYSSLDRDALQLEEVDLNKLIDEILKTVQFSIDERNGSVTRDELPKVTGNKTQIYQLFQNLINNGLKYQSADSAPHVHIGISEKEGHWQFSVRDNGIGMESRHLKKIFDVFQRLHRKDEYAGTGVGLSICKKIVERHGGKIWVESRKGEGSTFFFSISKANLSGAFDEQQLEAS